MYTRLGMWGVQLSAATPFSLWVGGVVAGGRSCYRAFWEAMQPEETSPLAGLTTPRPSYDDEQQLIYLLPPNTSQGGEVARESPAPPDVHYRQIHLTHHTHKDTR